MTSVAQGRIEKIATISYHFRADHAWPFEQTQADAIDAHWQKRLAKNPHLYDGRVLLMDAPDPARSEGSPLEGSCFAVDFKSFTAWRDMGCPDRSVANLFAMAALRTSDGAFLLGEMGMHTANPGRLYFPAGTPDLTDLRDGWLDLEGSVWRELMEETGFGPHDVTSEPGWTVIFEDAYIACMKAMQLPCTAREAMARFDSFLAQETDPELARLRPMFSAANFDHAHMPTFMCDYLDHVWKAASTHP